MNANHGKTIKSQSESTVPPVRFTDAQFMTAREKQLVLKDWERFLQNGLLRKHFTQRLYAHLHLHCGYLTHDNAQGFYDAYFQSAPDTERFFEYWRQSAERLADVLAYADIKLAMRARTDTRFAKELLRKFRF